MKYLCVYPLLLEPLNHGIYKAVMYNNFFFFFSFSVHRESQTRNVQALVHVSGPERTLRSATHPCKSF